MSSPSGTASEEGPPAAEAAERPETERVRLVPTRAALKKAAIASTPLVVLCLLAVVDFPLCPTRLGLGVPCPGCGLTRGTLAALSLDFAGVLRFHPLAPILTPVVAWSFAKPVLVALGWVKQSWLDRLPRAPQLFWWVLGAVMVGLWIGRLAGYFGGHPDPVDLSQGLIYRAGYGLWSLATSS